MVKHVPYYEDTNGGTHRDIRDAYRADLAIWFAASGVVNNASAKGLVDYIVAGDSERVAELRDTLNELIVALRPAPNMTADAA